MPQLTAEQQEFVERCWRYTAPIRGKFALECGGLDYDGAAALRLCNDAPRFDPAKSVWKTWAINTVRYACLELMRSEVPRGYRRRKIELPVFDPNPNISFACTPDPDGSEDLETFESIDAVEGRLRGLTAAERHLIRETIVFGRIGKDAARQIGYSESRGNQIKMRALEQLRHKEGLVPC